MTTIKFTTNTTTLIETQETVLTFRFELSEPPPPGGVRVYLLGNVPQSLTQLDLFQISFTGGGVPQGDFDFSGFFFNITSQLATVSAPIFPDGTPETPQSVVYTLQPGTGYTVDPNFSGVTVNFYDNASQVPPPPPPNDPPVAVNDSYSTEAGQQLVVAAANGVLSNDTDAQSDPLTAAVVQAPSNGSVTLNPDGSFAYTPNAGFIGTDSFTYLANDTKVNSAPATVNITVNAPAPPPNDPPVAVNDSYSTEAGQQLVVAVANGVLSNDTDAQSDPLTAAVVQAPSNGTLSFNADGSFAYTPNAGFIGTDSFTYLANDSKVNSAPATVNITVNAPAPPPNDPPVAVNDSYSTEAGQQLVVAVANGVLSNDTDAQSDPLTAAVVQAPSNGTLSFNADGSFAYTPNAGFIGTDSFTYLANDSKVNSAPATVSITVNAPPPPPNDPPIVVNDSYSTEAGQQLVVAVANGVLSNDTDAQSDPLTAAVVQAPSNGSVTLNPDGSFAYIPNAGFIGTDSFTYLANDTKVNSAPATVNITVNAPAPPPNDPPVAVNDSYSTEAGQQLVVAVANGVLSNDTDAQSDPLTAAVVQAPSNGSVTLNPDGSFAYIPNAGFIGTDSFTYLANDTKVNSAPATVNITVNAPATMPTLSFTASPTTLVEANNDSIVLTFQLSEPPPEGGLEVTFDSGVERSLAEFDVFSAAFDGLRFLRANATSSAVTVRLLQQTATITLPLFRDEVVEGAETFTYTLSPVPGYDFVPGENAITFTINDTAPSTLPVVGFTASPDVVSEAEGTVLTLTFNTTGDIPPEGITVRLQGDVANIMRQFTAAQVRFDAEANVFYRFDRPLVETGVTGGRLDLFALEADLSSFTFTILEPTATISLPVLNDILEESDATFTYTLEAGEGYAVDPVASSASFTVTDGVPGGVGPVVSVSATPTTLFESEQTAITITFTLDSPPPEGGVVVYLDSGVPRSIAQFNVTVDNPRNPEDTLNPVGLTTTGGTISGTNEFVSAVLFRITEQTATITVPVFNNGEIDGPRIFTYSLRDGEQYQVNPEASAVTITIDDAPQAPLVPTVSLDIIGGTFSRTNEIVTPNLVKSAGSGASVLSVSLSADAPIPEGSLIVNVNSDITDITQFIREAGPGPRSFGGEVIAAIYNEEGLATGFQFRMDQPNAIINFISPGTENVTDPETVTFFVQGGEGYNPSETATSTVTVYNTLDQVPVPTSVPEVGISVTNAGPLTEGVDETTLTFTVNGEIPPEGVLVYVNNNVRNGLGEFDLFNASFTGGSFPAPDSSASGFFFKITEPTASITLKPFADDIVEGIESFIFSLQPNPGYTVAADGGTTTLAIRDDESSLIQVSLVTEPTVLVESEGTVSVHQFSLSSPPPATGVTVSVSAPNLGEFDLGGIEITGGTIAAVRADGFDFTITDQTATINLPVANDGIAEGLETAVFTVVDGEGYQVNPQAATGSFTIVDIPAQAPILPMMEAEPNDTIATAQATGLSVDKNQVVIEGAINFNFRNNRLVDQTEDVDMYSFELAAGDTVRIDTDAEQLGSTLDSVLRVFDAEGNQLAQSDDDGAPDELFVAGVDSYLEFTAETAGTYYVGVSSFPNGEFSFNNNPYDPLVAGSGTGRSSGTYTLNLSLNQPIVPAETVIDPGTGDGVTVSLLATPGTYDSSDNLLANALVQSLEDGASILTLGLTVSGAIHEDGLEVVLNSNIDLRDYFELGAPFSPGAEVLGAVYDAAGVPTGIRLLVTERNAIANLNLQNLPEPSSETPEPITFTLLQSVGYSVGANATITAPVYSTLADVPTLPTVPTVGLSISETALVESLGNTTTLTFTLNEAPPAEGVLVYVDSGVRGALGEFDVLNAEFVGGAIPAPNFRSSGFFFRITEQTASITLSAFDDGILEGIEELTFTVQPGVGYAIASDASAVTLTIADNPESVVLPTPDGSGGGEEPTIPSEPTTLNETIATAIVTGLSLDNPTFVMNGAIGITNQTRNFIDATEDVDMYAFDLEAGQTLVVDIDASGVGDAGIPGSLLDSVLRVFDAEGNQLAIASNVPAPDEVFQSDGDPYIRFTAPATGTYYVGISNLGNDFYDPNVAGSGSGWIFPGFYEPGPYRITAELIPAPISELPVVGFTASPDVVSEAEGTVLTLTFNTTGDIPPEGITVRLQGDVANIMRQFTAAQVRFDAEGNTFYRFDRPLVNTGVTGGTLDLFALETDLSSFTFTILQPTATISLPVLNDILEESDATFTYTLEAGEGYAVDPAASSANFTVTDGVPGGVGPVVSVSATPTTLFESEQTVLTITFTLDSPPPEGGVVVYLDSGVPRSIAQFDVTVDNPRNPEDTLNPVGLTTTGGTISGTNEFVSAVLFRITEQTATITVPVFNNGEVDGPRTYTYVLRDGEQYQVNPDASQVTITIDDAMTIEQPVVGISATPVTADAQNNLLAYGLVKSPEYTDAEGTTRTGAAILNLSLNVDGVIPEEGLVVDVITDLDLWKYVNGLNAPPFSPGAQVLEGIYDEAGNGIGFKVRVTSPNSLIVFRLKSGLAADDLASATFSVQAGEGYSVNSEAAATTFPVYNTLQDVPAPSVTPEVSFSATNTTIVESEGGTVTLNFSLSEPPPPEGVVVLVRGAQFSSLSDFDVLQAEVVGGEFPALIGSNSFYFRITEQTASITVAAFPHGVTEGLEVQSYSVVANPGYTVNSTENTVVVTIQDTPESTLPLLTLTRTPATLIETAGTVSRHTFTLTAPPAAEGVVVSVSAPNLSEFDLAGISVTGGTIVAVREDGFDLSMTAQRAVIDLPVKNDGITEGTETAVFSLQSGAGYIIGETNNQAIFTILDAPLPLSAEVESNDTIATANDTRLSEANPTLSITGAIDYSGVNRYRINPTDAGFTYVDNTEDVDLYKVELKAGDRLAIDIDAQKDGSTLSSALQVFDAEGNVLAANRIAPAPNEIFVSRNDSYINFTAPADGVYYIGVSSNPNYDRSAENPNLSNFNPYDPNVQASGTGTTTGAYTLNLSLNPEVGAVVNPALPVPSGDRPLISIDTITGTYSSAGTGERILSPYLVTAPPSGAAVLAIALTADGVIPEGGAEVIINSDIILRQYFGNSVRVRPFSVGGEIGEAIYDPATGEATGFTFKLTQNNAFINIVIPTSLQLESPQAATFSLLPGNNTRVNPDSDFSTVTFYPTLEQAPVPTVVPQVGIEISQNQLIESEGTSATLTFTLDQAPPAEGVLVYVNSGVRAALGEFDVFATEVNGASFPIGNFRAGGFYVKLTEQTSTITLSAFDDGLVEGIETFTFSLETGAGYTIDSAKPAVTLSIADTPASQVLVSYAFSPATLVESENTVGVHTFSLSSPPPAEGLTIFVNSESLGEFDLSGVEITGGEIVSVAENGFSLKITDNQAVVRTPISNDGIAEGVETAVFSIAPGDSYEVSPTANTATFTIYDNTSDVPLVETEGNNLAAINDTIPQAVDTQLTKDNTQFKIQATIGNAAPNFIDRSEDVDIYKVELKAGDSIKIDIDSLPFNIDGVERTQFVDTELRLFDAAGQELARNFLAPAPNELFVSNRDPYLEFTATTDGAYYIGVAANSNRHYDPFVAGSGGGRIIPASGINIGRYDLTIDLIPAPVIELPVVGFTASPVVNEAEGPGLVLIFNAQGIIPEEGIVVSVGGDLRPSAVEQGLQFRQVVESEGVEYLRFNRDTQAYEFRLTQANATVTIPVFDDIVEEADTTYTYQLLASEAYALDPAASSVDVTYVDGVSGGIGPVVSISTEQTNLKEGDTLTVNFSVDGEIPEGGLKLFVLSPTRGALGEFVIFNEDGTPAVTWEGIAGFPEPDGTGGGFFVTLTEPTASLTLQVFDDGPNEGVENITFNLVDGELYEVNPDAGSITLTISELPVVGFTASPVVNEAEGPGLVLIFNAQGIIPEEGIVVSVGGDLRPSAVEQGLQFRQVVESEGVEYLRFNRDTQAYEFRLTQANATVTIPVFDDIVEEADTTYTYQLLASEAYALDPAASSVDVTYVDGVSGGIGPVVSISTEQTNLKEGDTLTVNFSVDGEIPEGGLKLFVLSPTRGALGEFVIFNEDGTPAVTWEGIAGFPEPDGTGGGFFVTLTEPTASLTLKVFDDGANEGIENITFNLVDGELYEVNPDASGITLTISDAPTNPVGDAGDNVIVGDDSNNSLFGNAGNDRIFGGLGNDYLFGGAGDDYLDGGDGNDALFGGDGNDTLLGGAGNDYLTGGAGDNLLDGGDGNDILYAGAGNNTLLGGAGDDIIYSGSGQNLINGGLGNDLIFLNGGQDTVVVAQGAGVDTINNFQVSLGQKVGLSGGLSFEQLTLNQSGLDTLIQVGDETLAVLKFVQSSSLSSSSFTVV
ncbi:Ig-like domain-containing protein [Nostoc sp. UHCC 0870]|uniref:Ig-like domain-containing protein n=1 Tax=Nostoc sp. UHCC 0870 TaxID=2914041 RepID=UPI001EDCEBAD|nr:Ig-like domain-containing protein [Nostoc sp. UHCC 0870]UKP00603.1 Ig-like domain-containing protein [Nostoc sp. UHCC 0870]